MSQCLNPSPLPKTETTSIGRGERARCTRNERQPRWFARVQVSGSRYRYLQLIPAEQFHDLLQVEIGFELLGDILTAMHSCWTDEQPEDSQFVLRVLKTLPTAFRFELAVSFLAAGENQAVAALLEKLEQVGSASNNELSELRDEFKLE